mmetsp:Transcript_58751/g.128764  ORF Transcript_58751/g.128764 Transcript_58751/m.128764 type:complete len:317 (+) Transcript_58751:863-1813(+)
MKDRLQRANPASLLDRCCVREGKACNHDKPRGSHHLPLGGSRAFQGDSRQGVGTDDAIQHHHLHLLEGAQQCATTLSHEINTVLDGRGPGGERRGNGRVSWANHGDAASVGIHQRLHGVLRLLVKCVTVLNVQFLGVLPQLLLHPLGHLLESRDLSHDSDRLAPSLPLSQNLLEPLLLLSDKFLLSRLHELLLLRVHGLHALVQQLNCLIQHLFRAVIQLILGVLRQLLGGVHVPVSTQQSQPHVSLLQGANVIAAVAAHEDVLVVLLQLPDNSSLALWRHARKDDEGVGVVPELGLLFDCSQQRILCGHKLVGLG